VARVAVQLEIAFPFAFQIPADLGALAGQFHLGRPGFFKRKRRRVSSREEIAAQLVRAAKMGLKFRLSGALARQRALDRERDSGISYRDIGQRCALHVETRDNNRSDPIFSLRLFEVDDCRQFLAGDFDRAFPAAGCVIRGGTGEGGSQNEEGRQSHRGTTYAERIPPRE